jgi:hypothetical protein
LVLGMMKVKTRSLVQWLYSALCAHNLGLTSLKIGESTKIGVSIDIATWKLLTSCLSKNLFMRGFMMDGNFQAEHMRMRNPENDVPLSDGTGFMVSKKLYELHLKSAVERRQVGSIICVSEGTRSCSDRDLRAMITVQ